jgi:hypothetical protein
VRSPAGIDSDPDFPLRALESRLQPPSAHPGRRMGIELPIEIAIEIDRLPFRLPSPEADRSPRSWRSVLNFWRVYPGHGRVCPRRADGQASSSFSPRLWASWPSRLMAPRGESITDWRDLEIGHIERQVVANHIAISAETRRCLRYLRRIRNCLAHQEVVSHDLLTENQLGIQQLPLQSIQ